MKRGGADLRPERTARLGCGGQGLVEYALVILLVAVACFAALGLFGTGVNGLYAYINGSF